MFDRNVIETWLEICGKNGSCSPRCPYGDEYEVPNECRKHLMTDAFTLLKEQDTKDDKWILEDEDTNSWGCPECGGMLTLNNGTPHENDLHFCPYCGTKLEERAVKRQ